MDESVDADGHHERIPLHLKLAEKLDGRWEFPLSKPATRLRLRLSQDDPSPVWQYSQSIVFVLFYHVDARL